jgi:hypothetical protein
MYSHPINWTTNARRSAVQHMGINHCRLHIVVTQKFLYRPDVVATFQQVRCIRNDGTYDSMPASAALLRQRH